ncbi:osmotically-inducible protein OsmY [Methylobacterium brachiatum]|jgi:osmotically-inducible protein OsmY|uniref:Osmotically-inducible protein OsmY n=1 Tax=Methylobacterium brachiatum TaxID=269660 RepID=A0AAJ1TN65_9HYPH|nr:BON domain-containing protein [Methylobacterium brachiatum]MCB4800819.1 BON domain-containing protein [Methylobacterium brachiatum]MDF2599511.1 transport-associated protein [Methylobacterium brachiatum]MDQ0541416.1 osmotically-inducible protein OsmY [Methylobacterium brachiatum]
MDDRTVRRHVTDELDFAPMIDAAQIGVAVENGVVTLTGHVRNYAEKRIAERVALRVRGVRAVVEQIGVRPPDSVRVDDEALADRCAKVLEWDVQVPERSVEIKVAKGCVTLQGCVPHYHQKAAVDKALRRLAGVTDIVNLIAVTPPVQPDAVKARILAALKRNAKDPDTIRVEVDGDVVILDGCVDVWRERDLAERAAWSAPGVRAVEDRLTLAG